MRLSMLAVAIALVGAGCRLEWDRLDPRRSAQGGAPAEGPGGAGGTLGMGGMGGTLGSAGAGGGGGAGGSIAPVCGNGSLEAGEQCDDGNEVGGDGCDSACEVECAATGFRDPASHHCYEVIETASSWNTSHNACLNLGPGFDLAAISSPAELALLGESSWLNPRLNAAQRFWVGGRETSMLNVYAWTNGETFDDAVWHRIEPNNYMMNPEDCTDLVRRMGVDGLNDEVCTIARRAICERTPAGE